MVQPLSSFCCGCPLEMGVRITLTLHLLSCLFYMATCWLNVVVEAPTLGSDVAMGTQAFNCGFALASLPFVVSGFSGVFYEIEVHLRVYLYWLILTVSMDSVLYAYVLCQNSCAKIPVFLEDVGGAFSCGFMRMAGTLMLASWLVLMGYNAFTVWSLCEELQEAGCERGFTDLAKHAVPDERAMALQHKGGLFGTGPALLQPARPVVYGSLSSQLYGGSVPIFGGETAYRQNRHHIKFMGEDIHDRPTCALTAAR
ncbi:unnamed protein product [Prorocentrum cordatum]|uniref:MARVEL domain-containing protein n=1 Tax=Prorocentrum cordatum TaxID=2364126 RepID=A0ABN9Y1D1_9DINO|nr:unnamed protein product [Polarella glacialis]